VKKRLPVLLFAILAALALTACGSSESDEDKIVNVIETGSTSTDPADCEALQTLNFMEQGNEGEGKEAVKECEEDATDETGNPDSVDVSEVEIEGSEASAVVAVNGGSFDGQVLAFNLVEEEGGWKLNEIEAFVTLDREKLIAAFEEGLAEAEPPVEEELAACVIEGTEEISNSELEELVLGGPEGFVELAEECTE
jgi:ABC-type glycerol-3-phosphate transport system substrate-binding protein